VVFVREAGKLGCQGIWSVDRVEQACLEFLRLATIDALHTKGIDKSGSAFAQGWIGTWGGIESRVMREFERSEEWRQFQGTLLQLAGRQGAEKPEGGAEMSRDSVGRDMSGNASPQVADVAAPAPELPVLGAAHQISRRAAVDAFLLECNKQSAAGSKVVKKHIWLAAGHTRPRQFQYWQSGSDEATDQDDRNFRRFISMPPGEFLGLLKKKGILLSKP
jgi:hypothetical protein